MRARIIALLAAAAFGHAALAQMYTRSQPISIPDSGPASVYPSTITVTGMGPVESVAVVLNEATHSYVSDLDILLVGPNGVGVYLLSDAGTSNDFNGGYYGFASGGESFIPVGTTFPSRIYTPTFTEGDDSFPNAVYTYGASLGAFSGSDANGVWRLYIMDDSGGDYGVINGGWSLVFNSRAPAAAPNTFTYQGRLDGATGPVDLRFTLHRTEWFPSQLSAVDWQFGIGNVTPDEHGTFTVQVPYTPLFMDGEGRYLEVAVSPAGQNDYTVMTPRQPITMAPMAEWANKAASVPWSGVTGLPASLGDNVDNEGPWSLAGNNVTYAAGWVGVGTSSPLRRFHVSDTSAALVQFQSAATNGTWLTLGNGSTNRYFQVVVTGTTNNEGPGHLLIRPAASSISYGEGGITVLQDGKVAINTYVADQTLSVNGNASKSGGGSWATYSDARLKHDITPLTGSLDKLLKVRGVSFFYNEPEKINELAGQRTGVVAQEVEKVFPEWVDEGASGYKSVTFRGFEALTIEALRDLRAEKDAQIKTLHDENAALKARLERVEHALESK